MRAKRLGARRLAAAFMTVHEARKVDLIAAEKKLIKAGAPSYYTVIVARPKRGVKRWYASFWYWFAPKVQDPMGDQAAPLAESPPAVLT